MTHLNISIKMAILEHESLVTFVVVFLCYLSVILCTGKYCHKLFIIFMTEFANMNNKYALYHYPTQIVLKL